MKLHIDPRKRPATIPVEVLREHVGYDPKTGELWWKKQTRGRTLFVPFGRDSVTPYIQFGFERKVILAHRAAFAIHYGRWPSEVDHKNHNTRDNRIKNLRDVPRSKNIINQARLRKNNTSGVTGVSLDPFTGKWRGSARVNGKMVSKRADSFEEAVAIRGDLVRLHYTD